MFRFSDFRPSLNSFTHVARAFSFSLFLREGALKQLLLMLGGLALVYQLAKLMPNESPVVSFVFIPLSSFDGKGVLLGTVRT